MTAPTPAEMARKQPANLPASRGAVIDGECRRPRSVAGGAFRFLLGFIGVFLLAGFLLSLIAQNAL